MLQHVLHINLLYDFYAPLLTSKQREVLKAYYEDDLSLGEIAAAYSVSRQAVHDLLQRGEAALEEYEQKLGLVSLFLEQRRIISEVLQQLNELCDQSNKQSVETIKLRLRELLK